MTSAHSSAHSPQDVSLPPGAPLLAEISTLAELKVTIAAFQECRRVGHSTPITFTEFQQLTGLGRSSVTRGLRAALARGTLARRPFGNSYAYYPLLIEPHTMQEHPGRGQRPRLAAGAGTGSPAQAQAQAPAADPATIPAGTNSAPVVTKTAPIGTKTAPIGTETAPIGTETAPIGTHTDPISPIPAPNDCDHDMTIIEIDHVRSREPEMELVRDMQDIGFTSPVCARLIKAYPADHLRTHLRYARHARATGFVKRTEAAFFVRSAGGNWDPPPGFALEDHLTPAEAEEREREGRRRYITGRYAGLIRS